MCAACTREYHDPDDRRFHAQPNACPACGPQARLIRPDGLLVAPEGADAPAEAWALLRRGEILAVKGLGGYQLACLGTDEAAVARLRRRKRRSDRPFALMARDIEVVARYARVSMAERLALESPEAPIVILNAMKVQGLAPSIVPGQRTLGFMLPNTPLHYLLIEKAEETFVAEEAEAAAARLLEGTFTLDDFLEQLRALRKMGSISSIMGMVPGMAGQVRDLDEAVDERRIDRIEGIINSMTPAERLAPDVIDGSRRARIAAGSGTQVGEINQLVKQFREMRKMMKQMGGRGPGGRKAGSARKKKGRGGRVTAAGPAPIDKKKGLSLPGLGDLPGDQGPSSGGLDLTGLWPSD